MFSSIRSPKPPKTRTQKVKEKIWFICCSYKTSCSVWMLLLFGLFMLYLRENYTSLSVTAITKFIPVYSASIPEPDSLRMVSRSDIAGYAYLHPLSYKSLGYGTCPYLSPTFPNIGPEIAYICPSDKAYTASAVWQLQNDVGNDAVTFFKQIEFFKQIVRNNTDSTNKNLQIRLKKASVLNIGYQYVSCHTKRDIKTLKTEWKDIIKDDEYRAIFKRFGLKSWQDLEVCFDAVLCANDNYFGEYSFNLYLNEKSQNMLKTLVAKTEQIEEEKYSIDLTLKRENRKAFHVILAHITNSADYDSFDAKALMDEINKEMKGKFPCIKLAMEPTFKNEWCHNTKKLQENSPRFQWKCAEIE